jgi:antitoxin VapB
MAETTEKRAKLFMNGRSQAVRLPKEFRFEGEEVRIRRSGHGVLLEPVADHSGIQELDRARKVLNSLGPLEPEFSAMLDGAIAKLQGGGGDR